MSETPKPKRLRVPRPHDIAHNYQQFRDFKDVLRGKGLDVDSMVGPHANKVNLGLLLLSAGLAATDIRTDFERPEPVPESESDT